VQTITARAENPRNDHRTAGSTSRDLIVLGWRGATAIRPPKRVQLTSTLNLVLTDSNAAIGDMNLTAPHPAVTSCANMHSLHHERSANARLAA